MVKQCVDKGLIKGTSISIDATHTSANTVKKVPERVMKHLAKKILKNLEEETKTIPENVDTTIPDYKEIEDQKVAKTTMENYLNNLVESVENSIDTTIAPETKESLEKAKEVLSDPKFIQQKGLRSLVDEDARVGYKSKTESFLDLKLNLL